MKSKIVLQIVLSIFLSCSIAYAEGVLDTEIPDLEIKNESLSRAIDILSIISNVDVVICLEEVSDSEGKNKTFDLSLTKTTLKTVLDRVVEILPNYRWELDDETQIINIYPKNNAPMDWIIPSFTVKNKTFKELMFSDEKNADLWRFYKDKGMNLYMNCFWGVIRDKSLINLNVRNTSARKVLNKVWSQLGKKASWIVDRQGKYWTLYFIPRVRFPP